MCSAIGLASAFPVITAGSIAFAVRIPEAGAVFVDVTAPDGVIEIISSSSAGHGDNDDDNDDYHDGDADAETAAQTHTAADGPGSSVTGCFGFALYCSVHIDGHGRT